MILLKENIKLNFRYVFIGMISLLVYGSSIGQENDTLSEFERKFNNFSDSISQDFNQYRSSNDSIFISFLNGIWKEFDLFEEKRIEKPKPSEQPEWNGERDNGTEIKPAIESPAKDKIEPQINIHHEDPPFKLIDPPEKTPTKKLIQFGIDIDIPEARLPLLDAAALSERDVADYYAELTEYDEIQAGVHAIVSAVKKSELNGWGLFQLMKSASGLFSKNNNDKVLYTWYSLIQSGIDARIGLNESNIYLFIHTDAFIYNTRTMEMDGKKYYLFFYEGQERSIRRISSYDASNPGNLSPLSLSFSVSPRLGEDIIFRQMKYHDAMVELSLNKTLLDYYITYPDCHLEVYFSAPMSEASLNAFDHILLPQLKGKTDLEKVNALLYFVQHSFPYQLDEQQFGREKYMFAEEAIYYPFTDCEDRSVLLTQLLRHYTGLPVIGLDFPEHVAIGVSLKDNIPGDFVTFRGERYYICDPTFIGAEAGVAMEVVKGTKPNIIFVRYLMNGKSGK